MLIFFVIGRVVLGLYYLYNGLNHLTKHKMMTGYAQSMGVPIPGFAVGFTGLMLTLGGLSILLGAYVKIGIALIVLFLVPVAFKMHAFWKIQDPMMRGAQMVHFMKNLALAASALMLLDVPAPWPWSLGI